MNKKNNMRRMKRPTSFTIVKTFSTFRFKEENKVSKSRQSKKKTENKKTTLRSFKKSLVFRNSVTKRKK